jgi:hypothetical protein
MKALPEKRIVTEDPREIFFVQARKAGEGDALPSSSRASAASAEKIRGDAGSFMNNAG